MQSGTADTLIVVAAIVALVWGLIQFYVISSIPLKSNGDSATTSLTGASKGDTSERLIEIYTAIYTGADSFLKVSNGSPHTLSPQQHCTNSHTTTPTHAQAEYTICSYFVVGFGAIVFVSVSAGTGWDYTRGGFTATAFVLGAITSMVSGYLGMKVAVYSNVRTTISAQKVRT